MKFNKRFSQISAAILTATPILTVLGGTTSVFAAPAGGTGTGRIIGEDKQSVEVNSTVGTSDASGSSVAAIEFLEGSLTLDQVPQFDFGAHQLQEAPAYKLYSDAPALTGITNLDPNAATKDSTNTLSYHRVLQVTDRTSNTKGWEVKAWAEPLTFTTTFGSAIVLSGAQIDLKTSLIDRQNKTVAGGSTAVTYSDYSTDDHIPNNPITYTGTPGGSALINNGSLIKFNYNSSPTESNADVTTIWGVTRTNNTATDNTTRGKGTWAADFGQADTAYLELPLAQQNSIGVYQSKIHWTLAKGVQ